jgi:hypothetical protein
LGLHALAALRDRLSDIDRTEIFRAEVTQEKIRA